jgi:hypothetical protein
MFKKMRELSALPEDDATAALEKIDAEVLSILEQRANRLLARNN